VLDHALDWLMSRPKYDLPEWLDWKPHYVPKWRMTGSRGECILFIINPLSSVPVRHSMCIDKENSNGGHKNDTNTIRIPKQ
jgi:hypothetical protein